MGWQQRILEFSAGQQFAAAQYLARAVPDPSPRVPCSAGIRRCPSYQYNGTDVCSSAALPTAVRHSCATSFAVLSTCLRALCSSCNRRHILLAKQVIYTVTSIIPAYVPQLITKVDIAVCTLDWHKNDKIG